MLIRGIIYRLVGMACLLLVHACSCSKESKIAGLQIAVLSDIHLQDVFGKFSDADYRGVKNPEDGKHVLIRSMGAQLHSTRLFNENYFVFLAALENIAQRNIKYVIIPGDFSDDGQAVNVRVLKNILERYSRLHDMSFFLTIGNHDVVQPFGRESGKRDFLGSGGRLQPIMSKVEIYNTNAESAAPVIVTQDIKNLGYSEVVDLVGRYGFLPSEDDNYWETPFSEYDYDSYSFEEAGKSASLENRSYSLPINGIPIPDMSYLVEPVSGLWLLALDGNTYLKKEEDARGGPDYVNNGGYNAVIAHRKYLIDWVSKVTEEAEMRGKTLIAFSHYPMVDFNDGATELINTLTKGEQRVPKEEVGRQFADAGLTVHFGGHMHINDTGILTTENGNTLVNIQVPSLAAYLPAYKLLTVGENNRMNIETVVMDAVPGFDQFFELYKQEYSYLDSMGDSNIWDKKILESENYREFINWHLTELVRLRLLPREWPADFTAFVLSLSGAELLTLSLTDANLSSTQLLKVLQEDTEKSSGYWKNAITAAEKSDLHIEELGKWSGFDLFLDYYRLRGADELAYADIGEDRLAAYEFIIDSFLKNKQHSDMDDMRRKLVVLMSVFQKFLNGAPSDHFELDLDNGEIVKKRSVSSPLTERPAVVQ